MKLDNRTVEEIIDSVISEEVSMLEFYQGLGGTQELPVKKIVRPEEFYPVSDLMRNETEETFEYDANEDTGEDEDEDIIPF